MKRTLYSKFLLVILIFTAVSCITFSTVVAYLVKQHLISEKAASLYTEATMIANKYGAQYYNQTSSISALSEQLSVIDSFLNTDTWIVNTNGEIAMTSAQSSDDSHIIINGFDPTASGAAYWQTGTYYGMFYKPVLSVTTQISSHYSVRGYVVIHYPMSLIENETTKIIDTVYIAFFIILFFIFLLIALFTWKVYLPLTRITKAANEYAAGNFSHQLKISSKDEIGYLASSLNYMSDELSKLDDYQKKFIANVSHDFRSPLTSIKGYVEAILDGTIPYEMQDKYLNTVLFETERLNKLTSSLLTLSNLDTKASMLDISSFEINNIIKKTVATFEGICKNKKITFDLTFSDKYIYVRADMGKIQQVLYNLIDNAVKFSNSNSAIQISVSEKNDKIFISVKDSGIGIPKDSIKKIWERFYKTDLSRGKDKKGTGLGLSITKEIIQTHGETIDVISTEGVGTEFIFTLPKAEMHS
jgi:signal transduction histidine kinase